MVFGFKLYSTSIGSYFERANEPGKNATIAAGKKFEVHIHEWYRIIENSASLKEVHGQIHERLQKIQAQMQDYFRLNDNQTGLIRLMQTIDAEVNAISQKLMEGSGQQVEKVNAISRKIIIAAIFVAIAMGLLFAWLTTHSITGPIRAMSPRACAMSPKAKGVSPSGSISATKMRWASSPPGSMCSSTR